MEQVPSSWSLLWLLFGLIAASSGNFNLFMNKNETKRLLGEIGHCRLCDWGMFSFHKWPNRRLTWQVQTNWEDWIVFKTYIFDLYCIVVFIRHCIHTLWGRGYYEMQLIKYNINTLFFIYSWLLDWQYLYWRNLQSAFLLMVYMDVNQWGSTTTTTRISSIKWFYCGIVFIH